MTEMSKELEKIEVDARVSALRQAPHILHPAGGLTATFVYEPVEGGQYVYKTKDGTKGLTTIQIEFEDQEKHKRPHFSISVGDARLYFSGRPPKEFLFTIPNIELVEKWAKGEKQSLTIIQLQHLNSVYLRTFLDFPHDFEFSVTQLFIQQSWLTEILPVVFYIGVKGEFGGGKTVTGEAIVSICKHGYLTGNLSPPFVARSIQNQKLTLMVDELDSIAQTKDSDLNSIFRQGYRRGIKYSRVNPNTLEIESYDIFGPKLFTVHSDIEEALQTRTIPIHVRETSTVEFPVVNLDKAAFSKKVYSENFLWYMDNILTLRDEKMSVVNRLVDAQVDVVDIVDLFSTPDNVSVHAAKIRQTLFKNKKSQLSEGQLGQLCQLAGRNVELMYICFILSNLIAVDCLDDIVKTFAQKLLEEGERTEIGYVGVLREVLSELYKEKKGQLDYLTEDKSVKISNKEIYETFNAKLKKTQDQGVSPATFKGYMLEFGFTDALNRIKLKVPIPSDPEPKSRLCNIFSERVLRKLRVAEEEEESLRAKLAKAREWIATNKDSDGLVDSNDLTKHIKSLGVAEPAKLTEILKKDGVLCDAPKLDKFRVS